MKIFQIVPVRMRCQAIKPKVTGSAMVEELAGMGQGPFRNDLAAE
jgi:hypothetical protein